MQKKTYTLAELADLLDAQVKGDASYQIDNISTLQDAQANEITFLDNIAYRKYLPHTKAGAVILSDEYASECEANALITKNPYLAFAKALSLFEYIPQVKTGIHTTAVIGTNCDIHPTASLGPYCVIGDNTVIEEGVVIGAHCILGENNTVKSNSQLAAHVTTYHNVRIGERCIVHSGVVIGSDGFGFAQDKGIWRKVPQIGGVCIGDDVEIGANTTIDRGALNDTKIDNGVKLDNQIQVGHNVHIGAHTAIAGCVAIAGSTKIGKHCMIGGGTCINGHISITDKVIVTGMSGIVNSIDKPGIYSGFPAIPSTGWKKNMIRIQQLDETAKRLARLEKLLSATTKTD